MVNVWRWVPIATIRVLGWLHIDKVKWHFSIYTFPESNNSFTFCMYSLIFANNYIFSRLPLKASLPSNDIIRHHLFTSKFFNSVLDELNTLNAFLLNLLFYLWKMLAFLMRSIWWYSWGMCFSLSPEMILDLSYLFLYLSEEQDDNYNIYIFAWMIYKW